METVPEEPQGIIIEKTQKNPWWVKVLPHYLIIGMFLDVLCNPTPIITLLLFIFVVLSWALWIGPRIQNDKIILPRQQRIILLILVVLTTWDGYPDVIKIVQWIQAFLLA